MTGSRRGGPSSWGCCDPPPPALNQSLFRVGEDRPKARSPRWIPMYLSDAPKALFLAMADPQESCDRGLKYVHTDGSNSTHAELRDCSKEALLVWTELQAACRFFLPSCPADHTRDGVERSRIFVSVPHQLTLRRTLVVGGEKIVVILPLFYWQLCWSDI